MSVAVRHTNKTFVAAEAIEQYRLLKRVAASGTRVELCDAEDMPIGISDQDDVAAEEQVNVYLLSAAGTVKIQAAGAVQIGDRVYPAANGFIDDVALSNGKSVGTALTAATAANDIIEVLLDGVAGEKLDGLIHANVADSAAITNTIVQTAFSTGGKTIRGADLLPGDTLHVMAAGRFPATNAADTATIRIRLGTEVMLALAATDVADADVFLVEAWIRIRTIGAAGTVSCYGWGAIGAAGTATARPFRADAAVEDISADIECECTCEWSAANAGDQAVLEEFGVELLRQ